MPLPASKRNRTCVFRPLTLPSPTKGEGRRAFTLVEILVATALTLIIMAVTVTLFGNVTENIAGSRAIIETHDRLRSAHERLVLDLRAVTARMLPPLKPESGEGYFEYVEGPMGVTFSPFNVTTPASSFAIISGEDQNGDGIGDPDTTHADSDDILMFTAHSPNDPFTGLKTIDRNPDPNVYDPVTISTQSKVAEIAWFVRGRTLYRRVLLVMPQEAATVDSYWKSMDSDSDGALTDGEYTTPFYRIFDLSARQIGGPHDPDAGYGTRRIVPNSLNDLTKRENRYAHQPKKTGTGDTTPATYGFPHSVARWDQLGLPTLQECSHSQWPFPFWPSTTTDLVVPVGGAGNPVVSPANPPITAGIDFWDNPHPWTGVNATTGALTAYASGLRMAEDVILTNVIGFDVKAWDPEAPIYDGTVTGTTLAPGDLGYPPSPLTTQVGAGAFVDLGYANNSTSHFSSAGNYSTSLPRVYDTWSTHYEADGVNQDADGLSDEGSDGIDNSHASGNATSHPATATTFYTGGVDDATEQEAPPPYPVPLRGIQVKVRVFEPDSRQIREVTVVQDFLPE